MSIILPGDQAVEYDEILEELTQHFEPADLCEARWVREMAYASSTSAAPAA